MDTPTPLAVRLARVALVAYKGLQVLRRDVAGVPMETYDGSTWGAWIAYSPTLTGILLGNGTLQGAYRLLGKTLRVSVEVIFGSTTTYAGGAGVSIAAGLPTGMSSVGRMQAISAWINDSSTGLDYVAAGRIARGASSIQLGLNGSLIASVNDSRPIAWAVSDSFVITGALEIA